VNRSFWIPVRKSERTTEIVLRGRRQAGQKKEHSSGLIAVKTIGLETGKMARMSLFIFFSIRAVSFKTWKKVKKPPLA